MPPSLPEPQAAAAVLLLAKWARRAQLRPETGLRALALAGFCHPVPDRQCRPQAWAWPTAGSNSSPRGGNPALSSLVRRLRQNISHAALPSTYSGVIRNAALNKLEKLGCASLVLRH